MSIANEVRGFGHKIRCPRHYLLKPGGQPFILERNPLFKNIKEKDSKRVSEVRNEVQKVVGGRFSIDEAWR